MMKRLTLIMAVAVQMLPACNNKSNAQADGPKQAASQNQTTSNQASGKSLVVFFSHTGDNYAVGNIKVGNTKKVADLISKTTGADQFELVIHKYDDMAYKPLCDLAQEEQRKGELPEYEGEVDNLDQYETIFIGGPVWWGTYPQVMFTFFNKHDLSGKTIIPFTTHEGSGMGNCQADVQKAFPKATVKQGLAIRGKDAQDGKAAASVEKWLKNHGF